MAEQKETANYSLNEKWGTAFGKGFVAVPSALFRYQSQLKLSDGELVVLMNLFMSWWKASEFPFPQTSTLAKRMGISARTVQRHIGGLEKKGFVRRCWSAELRNDERAITQYDLSGIVARLKEMGATDARSRSEAAKTTAGAIVA